MLSIIAAVSQNHVIGKDNKLIWHLPADMQFFKKTTMGHTLIMGRKTFESFGKPLPGRKSIVITRQKDWGFDGVIVENSLESAIRLAFADEEVFIIGGSEIYRQALPLCDKMYLTVIHHDFEGDSYFPDVDFSKWRMIQDGFHEADEKNHYCFSFRVYIR